MIKLKGRGGVRLDKFLADNVENFSRSKLQKLIKDGAVRVNGDDVKAKLRSLVKADIVREDLGKVTVLAVFKKGPDWEVVGGKVTEGRVEAGSRVGVLRGGEFLTAGRITMVQVGKEEVKDCLKGQECGMKFEGQPIIEEKDVLDIYTEQEVKKVI